MALRGPALVAALLAASGAAQETETPAGVCLLQKSPSQTHKVGRLDLTAVSAPLTKVHGLLDRHNKITMLIQQGGRRSGRAVHEAHSTVGKAITKLRKSYQSLADIAAAGGSPAALHSALLKIEAPAEELKRSLDHLEGVSLLQTSSSHTRTVEKHQHMGRSDLAALGAAHDNVLTLLDRHDKITMLIQQGGRRSGHAVHEAHSTVGKAITKLRKSYESLADIAAAGGSPAALHSALLRVEAPAKHLKKSLDILEGVCLLQKHASKSERKRQARSDLAALSAAYDNVHRLLDRHDKITMRIQQGGRRPSHAAKQAHSTVGKAIKKLRQSSESVVGLEAAAGSPKAMHTLLLQIEAPTKELKSGLDHLEEIIHEVDHAAKGA